jgi:hypothetical protein
MTENKRYVRNPDFIYRRIVDESVLVPIHQDVADMNSIYTLNGVGAFIWECLEQPATAAEVLERLVREYDADLDVLTNDLQRFLTEMININALQRIE